jgi:hypothetical protein
VTNFFPDPLRYGKWKLVRLTNIAFVCQGGILVQNLRVNQVGHELQRFVQVNPGHVKYQMIEVGVVIVRFT